MAICTLEEAKQHLADWLAADTALATGRSYKLPNGHELNRADLKTVKDRIAYWYGIVRQIEQAQGGVRRGRLRTFTPY